MKKIITLLFSLLIISLQGIGQSKKVLAAQIDSLSEANRSLSFEIQQLNMAKDSIQSNITDYEVFYNYISDKYFPPAVKNISIDSAMAYIDSLQLASDTITLTMESTSNELEDSLVQLKSENKAISLENKTFKDLLGIFFSDFYFPQNPDEYKGKWNLYLDPIYLLSDSIKSGIMTVNQLEINDSVFSDMLNKIDFMEEDLAMLTFVGGREIKCFYQINDFDKENVYYIRFDRGDQININMFVRHVHNGLQISYKVNRQFPGSKKAYYYGYMKK